MQKNIKTSAYQKDLSTASVTDQISYRLSDILKSVQIYEPEISWQNYSAVNVKHLL